MMPGNAADRMAHWQDAQELIEGYPVRRVWEIFNKMLVDRQKFILGSSFGWGGWGFLMRLGHGNNVLRYPDFVDFLTHTMDYMGGLYPIYPAESNLPLLNSFSTILQYGSRKYPELHKSAVQGYEFPSVNEYKPEEFYKTAAAGGDDEYEFINQNQLFEKVWNLLHYFGGVCIDRRGDGIPFWETKGDSDYPGNSYSSGIYTTSKNPAGNFNGLRFFYTPSDNLEYKYLCVAGMNSSGDKSSSGIVQYGSGRNILYESDWMSGTFTSPWIQEDNSYEDNLEFGVHLFIYQHFPDFYDPDTLEPIYF